MVLTMRHCAFASPRPPPFTRQPSKNQSPIFSSTDSSQRRQGRVCWTNSACQGRRNRAPQVPLPSPRLPLPLPPLRHLSEALRPPPLRSVLIYQRRPSWERNTVRHTCPSGSHTGANFFL